MEQQLYCEHEAYNYFNNIKRKFKNCKDRLLSKTITSANNASKIISFIYSKIHLNFNPEKLLIVISFRYIMILYLILAF